MYQGYVIKAKDVAGLQNKKKEEQESPRVVVSKGTGEAQITLEEAEKQAAQIIQDANEKAIKNYDALINEAKEKSGLIALEKAIELSDKFNEELASSEAKLGKLIADCVRKIIGGLPQKDIHRGILKTALREFGLSHALSIKVPSKSFDEAWWENWRWAKDNKLDVSLFEKDSSLEEGQLIIDFAGNEMDIGIQTQLDVLDRSVLERSKKDKVVKEEVVKEVIEEIIVEEIIVEEEINNLDDDVEEVKGEI